jgi:hypothetical protein
MSQEPSILLKQVWEGDGNAAVVLTDYLLENLTPDKWTRITGRSTYKRTPWREADPESHASYVEVVIGYDQNGRVAASIRPVPEGVPARVLQNLRTTRVFLPEKLAELLPPWLVEHLTAARRTLESWRRKRR